MHARRVVSCNVYRDKGSRSPFCQKKKKIVSYRHATRLGKGEVLHKRLQKSAPKVAVSSTQVEAIYQRRGMCVCERVCAYRRASFCQLAYLERAPAHC